MQTHQNFEVVITDDGSTDGSQDIIRRYAQKDSRFRPNYFPENRGVRDAFIDAATRTSGDYIYPAAADDFVVNKDFFRKAVTSLEADPRPAGFYGICGVYSAEKEKLTGGMGTATVTGYNTPLQCCDGFIKCRAVITSPSCIFRRELFMEYGGTEIDRLIAELGPHMDFFMNHAMAFRRGMAYENTLFACQRIFEAKTNLSAIVDLWKASSGYAELERQLRPFCVHYPEIERDWLRWRAFWLQDSINKSGHLQVA
jgi:glycosyltransferase involved in cell wall biosynthesis